jgi:hypothetical protein
MAIFAGLGLAGSGMGAFGSYMSGRQQRRQAEYNANLMHQRADAVGQLSARESELARERGRELKASQLAAYAKSGAVPTSGTPLVVMAEQAADMERDILERRRSRLIEQQQLRSQAEMLKAQGKAASRGGLLGGAAQLLGGAGKAGMLMSGTGGVGGVGSDAGGSASFIPQTNAYGTFNPQMGTIRGIYKPKTFSYRG